MQVVATGTAGEDHAGAGTARTGLVRMLLALRSKCIFRGKAASTKFRKEKPQRNATARRSQREGKDHGKGSRAKPESRVKAHGQQKVTVWYMTAAALSGAAEER